ncbi:hypothetical protein GQ600_19733 [Phytophthora cactorum]|nr:hypothetical protein GQ600_19733 [Phytophthora cactorum]
MSATCYDTSVTPKTPKPFTEPLRSRTSKVDIYIVLLRGADGARTQEHRRQRQFDHCIVVGFDGVSQGADNVYETILNKYYGRSTPTAGVKDILDDRTTLSTSTELLLRKSKVKWVVYDDPTWEPSSHLVCGGLLYDDLLAKKSERRLKMIQVADED